MHVSLRTPTLIPIVPDDSGDFLNTRDYSRFVIDRDWELASRINGSVMRKHDPTPTVLSTSISGQSHSMVLFFKALEQVQSHLQLVFDD
jgi:hypothetical protein